MPFDIASLHAFAPAEFECKKCLALLTTVMDRYVSVGGQSLICPICRVAYRPHQPAKEFSAYDWDYYIETNGFALLSPKDALAHAKELAEIALRMRDPQQQPFPQHAYTPLRGLLKALSVARKFVHFTTYGGIPHLLIGALKVTAQRVRVRGIVAGAKGEVLSEVTVSELTNYREEAPEMHIKIYDPSLTGWAAMPHQKLIIIDGLLAFKGSANLSLAGWRKAAQDRDVVEVVTEVEQVIDLNNRLFAPIWAELSEIGDTIPVFFRAPRFGS
jgi:hypothetical protein